RRDVGRAAARFARSFAHPGTGRSRWLAPRHGSFPCRNSARTHYRPADPRMDYAWPRKHPLGALQSHALRLRRGRPSPVASGFASTVNFEWRDESLFNVYRANYFLRRLGFQPKPPGASKIRDRFKSTIMAVAFVPARNLARDGVRWLRRLRHRRFAARRGRPLRLPPSLLLAGDRGDSCRLCCVPPLHHHANPVLRPQRDRSQRLDRMARHDPEPIPLRDRRKAELRFHHREGISNALPRPAAKGEVGKSRNALLQFTV